MDRKIISFLSVTVMFIIFTQPYKFSPNVTSKERRRGRKHTKWPTGLCISNRHTHEREIERQTH